MPQKIVKIDYSEELAYVSDLKSQLKKCMGVWGDRIKRKILIIIFL
jgi:hypothetical protein